MSKFDKATGRTQAQASFDRKRQAVPWRRWYYSRAWKARRALQLKIEPLCRKCREMGKSRPANTADHVQPHRGNRQAFFFGELQSLCESCHSSAKQKEEGEGFARGVGADGWPTDPRHPFNRVRPSARGDEKS